MHKELFEKADVVINIGRKPLFIMNVRFDPPEDGFGVVYRIRHSRHGSDVQYMRRR